LSSERFCFRFADGGVARRVDRESNEPGFTHWRDSPGLRSKALQKLPLEKPSQACLLRALPAALQTNREWTGKTDREKTAAIPEKRFS
jgi:hypothetical protein